MKKVFLICVLLAIPNFVTAEISDEGIILGPFIFRPNFSFVFEHTDNLFLQGQEGFNDNLFIIRPTLQLVYPFLESSVQITYVPIWREYQRYELEHKFSHFITFESNILQSSGLNVRMIDRFVRGYLEVSEIEPQREVVWGTNRFNKNYFGAEALYDVTERINIKVGGDFNYVKFIDREEPLFFYDHNTFTIGGSVGYRTSPLTTMKVSYRYFDNDAEDLYNTRDFNAHQFVVGMDSEATPRLKGGFEVGFENRKFNNNGESISNFILQATLSYELTEDTRFLLNANRGTYQSAYFDVTHFKSTSASASLTHQFTERLSASGAGYFHQNAYPETHDFKRTDNIYAFHAEVGYIISNLAVVHLNYRYETRSSNATRYDFHQNRLIFDVLLGW